MGFSGETEEDDRPSSLPVRASSTVLIVEDDEADRKIMRRSLERSLSQYIVHEASCAETGLALFGRIEPDCILLDHHLPNCTGLEFLKRVNARGTASNTPVVMITGDDSQRLGIEAMKLGVAELISKTELDKIDLAEVVDVVLEMRDRNREAARRMYARKLASLAQLVAGAAHEINNPAAIARLTLSAVSDAMTEREADGKKYVTFQEADRLRALVQAADEALGRIGLVVRELERQTGSALGHIQSVTLNEAVKSARPSIERLMGRGRRTKFHLDCEVAIVGDVAQLSRVVVDLVDNALESIDDEGIVEIRCQSSDNFVELLVDDDGVGLDPEMRDRVFEPLFTTRQSRGALGMGLSRASAVVERHGGTITAERSPLGGARFAVRIPINAGEVPRSSTKYFQPISSVNGLRARILIVDDEPVIRDSYRRVLRNHYDVDVAENSEIALDMIRRTSYDAILCDVIMPGQDGVSFAKSLSLQFPEQARCLMFCTGGVLEAAQERFLSGWSNGYLRKPLSARELTDCLASFLRERLELALSTPNSAQ